ncbi:FG-GAP repeat domain-containing protein [Leisingera sp. ANG-DT]|uniref:FG-GAP repeat domain-containing protein n=1 Tax=Leisingera sp. ANG-DT TaxID=1577897 RepID=UPI00057CB320|nr:VCBS repeat-containing protein [Leisingera sp. ANG-DT]KIC16286.1 integrin [Leisingera sp. ANG-DT]
MAAGAAARRLRMRARPRSARRVLRALCLGLALAGPLAQEAGAGVIGAGYGDPTTRYGHAVLGDDVEYGSLVLTVASTGGSGASLAADYKTSEILIRLPQDHVFEDIAPRLADVDGDGSPEVLVVETDVAAGAQLAVYDADGEKITETPHIGTRNRWLAPIGAADLDGDGHVEIAYIDRPHLAKTLRIWRFRDGALHEVASKAGLTNHRIGEDFITSGIRDCGQGAELVMVSGDWRRIIAARLQDGEITAREIGPFDPDTRLADALACR